MASVALLAIAVLAYIVAARICGLPAEEGAFTLGPIILLLCVWTAAGYTRPGDSQ